MTSSETALVVFGDAHVFFKEDSEQIVQTTGEKKNGRRGSHGKDDKVHVCHAQNAESSYV
ncbi:hypothetical protein Bpfe_025227, partial [Biomphalaria pfeifferi]